MVGVGEHLFEGQPGRVEPALGGAGGPVMDAPEAFGIVWGRDPVSFEAVFTASPRPISARSRSGRAAPH
jgi:hypothetical protein